MSQLDFVAAVLAAVAVLRVWFRSPLFAGRRATHVVSGKADGVLYCPFCFGHHLAVLFAGGFAAACEWAPGWAAVARPIVYGLAAAPPVFWLFAATDHLDP
jgi:hypothetical protein